MSEKVYIIGIGMDGKNTLTAEASEKISAADILIGAKRMVAPFEDSAKRIYVTYDSGEICRLIGEAPDKRIAVLMSGDCCFYSGADKLLKMLTDREAEIISGISSPVYFCGKLGLDMRGMKLISLHGAESSIVRQVSANEKCFFLLGGKITAAEICRRLCEYGMSGVSVYIGEDLGYETQKIYKGIASDFTDISTGSLAVMITVNNEYERCVRSCIPDYEFIRGKVPMTKSEVRCLAVSKLNISADDICWDVGCGTGSVSVEIALKCSGGKVYSVDMKPEAAELTDANRKKFRCDNIIPLCGKAPDILDELPAPDKVFIGGSCGSMEGIISAVLAKNPDALFVVTAVSLETLEDARNAAEKFGLSAEIIQTAVTRTRKIGGHTMLAAENPVYIISMKKGESRCAE